MLSCIQPTGDVHLGNYLGALRNWVSGQHECDAFHGIVDLHALTITDQPHVLGEATTKMAAMLFAVGLDPDIATVFAGTNDVVRRHVDLAQVVADLESMQRALRGAGATVLTITLPDLSAVMPLAKRLSPRVEAMNEALRAASQRTGTVLVDLARYPVASDPRLWSADRLHANALGHARIAASLAHAVGLPGHGPEWQLQLPEPPARTIAQNLAREAAWVRTYLVPWLWRHARGRSSGDGRAAKRPTLDFLSPPDRSSHKD